MEKLIKKLASIPHDKLLHSFYGTIVYILLSYINPSIAIAAVFILAISKEIYDEIKYGGFDYKDIIATIVIPILIYLKELEKSV